MRSQVLIDEKFVVDTIMAAVTVSLIDVGCHKKFYFMTLCDLNSLLSFISNRNL